ncbi:MAG: zinc-ribbon domain-containing protein [Candidatus Kariarchaeaceae archaeon]|jgi:uncharacterized protein YxjI
MYCPVCGEQNPDGSAFCSGCGNNLSEELHYVPKGQSFPPPQQQQVVQFQPIDFTVQQKIFSFRATYKVSNANRHEFMVIRRNFINPFRPFLRVEGIDGRPMGHIQGNFWRTKWEIYDEHMNLHATIRFPFIMIFRKRFSIETADGIYNSGTSLFAYKFDAYAPDGQISFLVDKKIFTIRDQFQIKSFGNLNPYLCCLAAVTVDQRFHSKGGGGGLDFARFHGE